MSNTEPAFWNQLQAWAWVYTRNHDVVAGLADGAHEGRTFKQEGQRTGRPKLLIVETPIGPPTSRTMHLRAEVYDVPLQVTLPDAKASLLDQLLRGGITATGIANDMGDRNPIPATDWLDLDFYDNPMRVAAKNLSRANATVWHSVKFNMGDMLLIWPDPKALEPEPLTTSQQQTVKQVPAALLDEFFRARAKEIMPRGRAPSEKSDIEAVATKFAPIAVSRERIREMRRKFYPADSIRSGRLVKTRR